MNKLQLLTALLTLAATLQASATAELQCAQGTGNMIAGKITMNCLKIAGTAKLDGTTVNGLLKVAGPLEAKSAKLNQLEVAGKVKLTDSIVSGSVNISGALDAKNTTFISKIKISSKSATFSHSTLNSIEMTAEKPNQKAYIYLEDNSIVNGDITFKNGNGVVKNSHSKIGGKVIGGTVD